jgi:hypothetical protein
MKWSGTKASRRSHFKKLRKECKCFIDGTNTRDLDRVLRKYIPNVKRKFQSSIKILDKHLDSGGAVVLTYEYIMDDDNSEAHCILCIGRTKYYYTLVNDVYTKDGELLPNTVSKKSRKSMIKMLRIDNGMWLI